MRQRCTKVKAKLTIATNISIVMVGCNHDTSPLSSICHHKHSIQEFIANAGRPKKKFFQLIPSAVESINPNRARMPSSMVTSQSNMG